MGIRFLAGETIDGALTVNNTITLSGANNTAATFTLTNTAPTPDSTWTFVPQYNSQDLVITGTGKFDVVSSGGTGRIDSNGQIESIQALDVATAGGRFTGKSNRGSLGSIHIEQTTTNADGGYINLRTSASGSTNPTERFRITDTGAFSVGPSGTNYGSSGQVLTSQGNGVPAWTTPTTGTVTGSGSGGSLTAWAGAGTSVTLTNAPVTYSGNNTTFAGDITTVGNVVTGSSIVLSASNGRITGTQGYFGTGFIHESGGYATFGSNSSSEPIAISIDAVGSTAALKIETNNNATFAGSVTAVGISSTIGSATSGYFATSTAIPANQILHVRDNVGQVATNSAGGIKISSSPGNDVFLLKRNDGGSSFFALQNSSASEFMTVNMASGNVGIGMSPTYRLDVESNNNRMRLLGTTGYVAIELQNNANGFYVAREGATAGNFSTGNTAYAGVLAVQGNYNLQLGTNGVIRQTIDGSGNVGIGTTTPDYKLEVQGVISSADAGLQKATFANVGNDLVLTANADSTNVTANILFKSSGSGGSSVSEKMRIDGSGNVGIGVTDPVTKLEVEGSTNGIITMNSTGGTGGRMDFAHTGSNYGNVGSGKNLTGTGNATDMMVNADSVLYLGVGSKDVTINSSHNVGIGTTSPTSPTSVTRFLEIEGTTAGIVLHDDGNDAWDLFASGGKLGTRYNNSVEGWWLDHNGLMGVGTTAPVSKLHVQGGDIGVTTGQKIGWIYNPGGDNNMYNYLKTADDGGVPASHLEISGANWTSGNVAGVKFTHVVTGDLMTIMTGGNVGIGTTAPTANLHVVGSAASQPTVNIQAPGSGGAHLRLWDTTGGSSPYIEFGEGGSTTFTRKGFIQMSSNNFKIAAEYGEFQVWTGTNGSNEDQRLTVTSAGNVGIGETSASYKLRIKTDATLDNGIYLSAGDSSSNHALYVENLAGSAELLAVRGDGEVRINGSGTGDCKIGTTTGTPSGGGFVFDNGTDSILRIGHASGVGDGSNYVLFYYSTNIIGSITQSGTTAIAYNTSSDYRLKEDLKDFNGLDKVSKIPVYDFKWKVDESRSYGVMAHELQKVLPQAVTGNKDAEEMQGVDYSKIVPMLIKSVQELKIEIEELKIKIK